MCAAGSLLRPGQAELVQSKPTTELWVFHSSDAQCLLVVGSGRRWDEGGEGMHCGMGRKVGRAVSVWVELAEMEQGSH